MHRLAAPKGYVYVPAAGVASVQAQTPSLVDQGLAFYEKTTQ